ncbi:MAG: DEAD/DEAH box helicase family protein [Lentisphaerae bacterium]|jgi:type III restriction enzyme|nr:DEAD/DEAH box helicase family protein [Lentisphaerota bacterium]
MSFLFENYDWLRENMPDSYAELPDCISTNLNPEFELRPYQEYAFCNFITYFESKKRPNPLQVLFHMATGSGKTLIMAGLITYLYKKGYRNFLFFVNLDNIVKKTKDNFLNRTSSKYLFADNIIIDGEHIPILEVDNFQGVSKDAINICFTTIQGLHLDMTYHKENAPSYDDFSECRTVLIADEAHHLNVDTRKGKMTRDEDDRKYSWETTVRRIFEANSENVLLEFTATCDLQNPNILSEYENKIIFDYPLKKFREERFSKQVKAVRADISHEERALLALMFSQCRLKIFQDNRLMIKPVVLFKAKTIAESKNFEKEFHEFIRTLTGAKLEAIVDKLSFDELDKMTSYFASKNISYDLLAQELREGFSPERCLSVNDDKEADDRQILLNSLESRSNPYRAIFQVRKLDEGWDVLNLFDIVRLYETRDQNKGKPGAGTIAEAQLIGRGARYCPFKIQPTDEKYKRKYDNDLDNPLRMCEKLYYHCQADSRYIAELNKALVAIGITPDKQMELTYLLKDEFKKTDLYKDGLVFVNKREVKSRMDVTELLPSIRSKEYVQKFELTRSVVDVMMSDTVSNAVASQTFFHRTTLGAIAEKSYSLVNAAVRKHEAFKFSLLKQKFPNVRSLRQFITDNAYLGGIKVTIESSIEQLTPAILLKACVNVLGEIASAIMEIKDVYIGTTEFRPRHFHALFKNKTIHITNPDDEGLGVSQNDSRVSQDLRLDLSDKEWFVYNDNYGTTEEKAFVKYFETHFQELRKEYDQVYLVRNERELAIYSFEGGERFEPDYLLFLRKKNATGFEQLQLFVEPKGTHLLETDKWKEEFLLQIQALGIPVKELKDDNLYRIIGCPFFNRDKRMAEIEETFRKLLEGK